MLRMLMLTLIAAGCAGDTTKTDATGTTDGATDTATATDTVDSDATDGSTGDTGTETTTAVYVNEALALNDATNSDENGDFDDWFELYNAEATEVDLTGWTASDLDTTWTFPKGTTIAAGGHLLVWADDEPKQGPLHAPFTLSSGGDEVLLRDADGNEVDRLGWFAKQAADTSYGRSPDGSSTLATFDTPTPGAANP